MEKYSKGGITIKRVTIIIHTTNKQRAMNFVNALPVVLKNETIEYSIEDAEPAKKAEKKKKPSRLLVWDGKGPLKPEDIREY